MLSSLALCFKYTLKKTHQCMSLALLLTSLWVTLKTLFQGFVSQFVRMQNEDFQGIYEISRYNVCQALDTRHVLEG